MRDGLASANQNYISDALASFSSQGTTHILLLVVALVCGLLFMVVLFKPFLSSTAKESRRVAELLTQLPKDVDVEGMVAAAWKVVLQVSIHATFTLQLCSGPASPCAACASMSDATSVLLAAMSAELLAAASVQYCCNASARQCELTAIAFTHHRHRPSWQQRRQPAGGSP